jgi:hypothetical protein
MIIKIKKSYFFILIVLLLVLTGNFFLSFFNLSKIISFPTGASILIEPVLAEDIYPLFFCPCCGQPLDKNNICCDLAKERIDYIDSLVESGVSEDEIIISYVKKYGLNSFVGEEKQKEIREKLVASAPADRPIIFLNPESYDFGDVDKKGVVTTIFELKNEGKADLIINKLETSCGCTSASIVYQEKEGPKFNMPGHGINEKNKDWQVVIPSGQEAQLKVYYDPNVHKDFKGPATREISVFSNDPVDFEKKVKIELNQVD